MRLLLTALTIATVATSASAQAPYHALGTEPFWRMTIDQRTIRLEEAGKRAVTVAKPRVRTSVNGERYVARGLTVDVTHARCSDGMSDRTYPDTVTVRTGRRVLRGCGGDAVATSSLVDTKWTVDSVNGRPIRTYTPLTVAFTADRIEGKLCNSFGGSYAMTGDRLRTERVVTTRMSCRGPAMDAERTMLAMLNGPVTARIGRDGVLSLVSGRDEVRLRRDRR